MQLTLRTQRPGQAKTEVVAPISGFEISAEGGTQTPGATGPRPAAKSVTTTVAAHPRGAVYGCAGVTIVPAVLCPFINVSSHVKKAELVGLITPHGRLRDAAIVTLSTSGIIGIGPIGVIASIPIPADARFIVAMGPQ